MNKEEINLNKDEFNSINIFLNEIFKNKNQFIFKKLVNLPIKDIKYFSVNSIIFSLIYKNGNNFKFYLFDEFKKYYLNYDFSINEEDILKYKKLKIEGLNNKNKIEEIIEKENINLCDINLNINQSKYYIKSFKEVKSIYCEDEIEKNNCFELIKDIIIINGFPNLKYLNLTIGYINESPYEENNYHFYFYLSKLIKNAENLKSLILKLHPNNFIQNIPFYFSLIENLKKLRIVKIIENCKEQRYFNYDNLLNNFPKLKERIYCFEEFKIGNQNNYIEYIYNIKKRGIQSLLKCKEYQLSEEKMKEYFKIHINNKRIKSNLQYNFPRKGEYKIKIEIKKLLNNMSDMFSDCSSLTSLNLSNFNTNNVEDMNHMFYHIPESCKIIHDDKKKI